MNRVRRLTFDIFEKLLSALPQNPDIMEWRVPLPATYPKRAIMIEETVDHPEAVAPIIYEYALFRKEKDREGKLIWVFQGEILV